MRKVTLLSCLTLKNVTPIFIRNIWQLNSIFIFVKYLIWRIYFGKMNPIYFDCPSSHKNLDIECSLWMKLVILFFSLFPPVGFPVAQTVKNLPAMWETWVWILGWEDPLEEGMATHSSILAWRVPGDSGAWQLQYLRSQRVGHYWAPKYSTLPPATPFSLEKKYDILPKLRWKDLLNLFPWTNAWLLIPPPHLLNKLLGI